MRFISSLFFSFCALICLGCSSLVFADSQTQIPKSERQYIHPKSIQFTEKGIVVMHNGQQNYVSQVNVDENGQIYIPKTVWVVICHKCKKAYYIHMGHDCKG